MNILLFKLRYIGDVLLTTPAISLLRKAYPDAHITMVVNKGTEDVIVHNPDLNEILTVDKTHKYKNLLFLLKKLKSRKYDFSADFASGDRAAWFALWSGASPRIGLASNEGFRRWINNVQVNWINGFHTVELYIAIASEAPLIKQNKITPDNTKLKLNCSSNDVEFAKKLLRKNNLQEKNFIAAHTVCRYPHNRWDYENWIKLLNSLNFPVVFLGTADDIDSIKKIQSALQIYSVSLAGQTTILQSAAIMRQALGFIGHDSGPMHIAAAMEIPVVGIFGKTSHPVIWHPWTDKYHIISTNQTAEEVLQPVRSLLIPKP
ncbi:MAG TPA: glycosyltransferase family 9 protein [Verrucomicrobiota bacterium]|nr:glycosyltransferase family 9 protein [Verrucomicrobiota bacterium]